jgi:CheY-like chemotaxis protein
MGNETLVVAEGNDTVRDLVCGALRQHGHRVIEIARPELCLATPEGQGLDPALLLTDVIMPGLHGRDLSLQLSRRHPTMRSLFTIHALAVRTREVVDS